MASKAQSFSINNLAISLCFVMSMGVGYAKGPFHYGLGMCEYAYSERTDGIIYGVKGASSMPEELFRQQEKYCSSKENLSKAEYQLRKWKALPENELAATPPQVASNYNRAVDMVDACIAGSQVDAPKFQRIIKKYISQKDGLNSLELIRRSYEYGRTRARNDYDCKTYAMGR